MIEDVITEQYVPYDELVQHLRAHKYLESQDPEYYHMYTWWLVWRDEDYGSNQMVLESLEEVCDYISECGFCWDDLFVVEEVSTIRR